LLNLCGLVAELQACSRPAPPFCSQSFKREESAMIGRGLKVGRSQPGVMLRTTK